MLILTVGLPGTGKTTAARLIEVGRHALRLTKDEWMKALYRLSNPPSASDVIEGRLVEIGLRALELGVNVVIDYGLWAGTSVPHFGRRLQIVVPMSRCGTSTWHETRCGGASTVV